MRAIGELTCTVGTVALHSGRGYVMGVALCHGVIAVCITLSGARWCGDANENRGYFSGDTLTTEGNAITTT